MERSSNDSPIISSQPLNTPAGLFIPELVDNTFGPTWRTVVSALSPEADAAREWLHPQLFELATVTQIRRTFLSDRCLCLQSALSDDNAASLAHTLREEARFQPHHHSAYPLDIAPLSLPQPDVLQAWTAWLSSQAAARFHAWLVAWPYPRLRTYRVQVQVSQMTSGQEFPLHHDTDDEGIAVVYNLSQGWEPGFGGVLCFSDLKQERWLFKIPPHYNTMTIFRPRSAPHMVTPIAEAAEGFRRHTITAFYLPA